MKKTTRILAMLLALVMALSMSACNLIGNNTNTDINTDTASAFSGKPLDSAELSAIARQTFAGEEKYELLPSLTNVERDHQFSFEIDPNSWDSDPMNFDFTEAVAVYYDSGLEHKASYQFNLEKGETGVYSFLVSPFVNQSIMNKTAKGYAVTNHLEGLDDSALEGLDDSTFTYLADSSMPERLSGSDDEFFNQIEAYSDWGNMPQYYLTQYIDMETGKKLEKPLVQIFTVKQQLEAPKFEFYVSDNGLVSFRWDEVAGAEAYIVAQGFFWEQGTSFWLDENGNIVDKTNGIVWSDYSTFTAIGYAKAGEKSWTAESNSLFATISYSEDEIAAEKDPEKRKQMEEFNKSDLHDFFTVIAIGNNKNSSYTKMIDEQEIAKLTPYRIAYSALREDGLNHTLKSVSQLPLQIPVVMCDGSVVYRNVQYSIESVYEETPGVLSYMNFPCKVIGTQLEWTFRILSENAENWEEDLQKIIDKQKDLDRDSGTGDSLKGFSSSGNDTVDTQNADVVSISVPDFLADEKIFATNALSFYLAANMLISNETIPLTDFPEAADGNYFFDAFFEAYFQNPLILDLDLDGLDITDNGMLIVKYKDSRDVRLKKQREIKDEINKIIPQIIKSGMSDLEKEIAINDYLCENTKYDFACLENGATHNYEFSDPEFDDSFTAYGIMINKVGVCSSYAACFKLLAESAGMDAIVVNGTGSSGIGHAWNRFKIGGEWKTVDTTNNDDPIYRNLYLNLPDSVASKILTEKTYHIMDSELDNYTAKSDDDKDEYYHANNKYFAKNDIAKELAKDLKADGAATLRTDYFIGDSDFQEIIEGVAEELGTDFLFMPCLMGVITLKMP